MAGDTLQPVKQTPLFPLHRERGGKMVPFAGYALPVQYETGIIKEHLHTRASAGLFDVSHMGQVRLHGREAAGVLETLVPGDIAGLKPGRMRYTLFTTPTGGVIDDLMVINSGADELTLVVNAARKDVDLAHLIQHLDDRVVIEPLPDLALMALQGPLAATVMARFSPDAAALPFLAHWRGRVKGIAVDITRSGYTGEDGFEISCPADAAIAIAHSLLDEPEVALIGLGARDSLRLEAGLSLYGHELDTTITPIEAGLAWTIGKRRRETGGFPGADVILAQLRDGAPRQRVGIRPDGRAPAREGTIVTTPDGRAIGRITSGGYGPSVGCPIAIGLIEAASATTDAPLLLEVRGKPLPAVTSPLPFVQPRYHRG